MSDLWPVYRSGEASSDSKQLVESFLESDPAFSTILKEAEKVQEGVPALLFSPDAERRLTEGAQRRAQPKTRLIAAGMALVGLLAIGAFAGILVIMLTR